jgi:hypothetical protein
LIEPFPTIELDFGLFGKVLTEYAQSNGHIGFSELIEVQDINYDDSDKIVTAFITIISEPMN